MLCEGRCLPTYHGQFPPSLVQEHQHDNQTPESDLLPFQRCHPWQTNTDHLVELHEGLPPRPGPLSLHDRLPAPSVPRPSTTEVQSHCYRAIPTVFRAVCHQTTAILSPVS